MIKTGGQNPCSARLSCTLGYLLDVYNSGRTIVLNLAGRFYDFVV